MLWYATLLLTLFNIVVSGYLASISVNAAIPLLVGVTLMSLLCIYFIYTNRRSYLQTMDAAKIFKHHLSLMLCCVCSAISAVKLIIGYLIVFAL